MRPCDDGRSTEDAASWDPSGERTVGITRRYRTTGPSPRWQMRGEAMNNQKYV